MAIRRFIDASVSGDDVFIETASQLVGQDADSKLDIYDARVGGGFPFTPAVPSCAGDACKAPPAAVGVLIRRWGRRASRVRVTRRWCPRRR